MRRQLAIAALCTAILTIPSVAQMHGGSHGGGGGSAGRGGFSSSGSGFRGGSSFGVTARGGAGFNHGQAFIHSGRSSSGFHQPFFGPRRFRQRVFFPVIYPYSFGYYGYPDYYGSDFYSNADYYPSFDYNGSAYSSAQNDIAQQQQDIDRLEDEVTRLRQQRESGDVVQSRSPSDSRSEPATPALLVFRDQHTQEVRNYAIVGETLWIFNEQRATKLPMSSLDVDATTKANDERGLDFQVPR
jgi:hypothetical protein